LINTDTSSNVISADTSTMSTTTTTADTTQH
jgi:hypothetical protein